MAIKIVKIKKKFDTHIQNVLNYTYLIAKVKVCIRLKF